MPSNANPFNRLYGYRRPIECGKRKRDFDVLLCVFHCHWTRGFVVSRYDWMEMVMSCQCGVVYWARG